MKKLQDSISISIEATRRIGKTMTLLLHFKLMNGSRPHRDCEDERSCYWWKENKDNWSSSTYCGCNEKM